MLRIDDPILWRRHIGRFGLGGHKPGLGLLVLRMGGEWREVEEHICE